MFVVRTLRTLNSVRIHNFTYELYHLGVAVGGGPFLGGAELTFIWKSFHIGKCKTFRLAKSDEWERWGNLRMMVVESRG